MDRDAGVAEHGLGARGGDGEVVAGLERRRPPLVVPGDGVLVGRAVLQRVAQAPEVAPLLDLLDLEVGDRRLEMRVPVDEALAAEDQPPLVERHERAQHRVVEVALLARRRARGARHGEGVAREVERVPEPLALLEDRAARLRLPLPDLGDEGLAPHLAAARAAGLRQLALHHHLRRDPGVVEAGLPEHVRPPHPVPAREHVHQRVVERVPHVQRAGDVRRRQQDGEGLRRLAVRARLRVGARGEGARLLPERGDARLDRAGVEGLVHGHGVRSPARSLERSALS
jgi:hypothetical protein